MKDGDPDFPHLPESAGTVISAAVLLAIAFLLVAGFRAVLHLAN